MAAAPGGWRVPGSCGRAGLLQYMGGHKTVHSETPFTLASWERGSMRLRRSYLLVALAASVSMACPYSDIVIGTNGLAIAGGGTPPSDRLAFTVQPGTPPTGTTSTPPL